jgi:hypothetical protein
MIVAIASDDPATKYRAAFLTGIGVAGAATSRTFIAVQERAMLQMNFNFQQPLVQSYFLSAERMVQQMEVGDRALAWNRIVTSIVEQLLTPSATWSQLEGSGEIRGSRRNLRNTRRARLAICVV